MYKPPENTNRVKEMKMKFECQDLRKILKEEDIVDISKPKISNFRKTIELENLVNNSTNDNNIEIKPQQILNRQLSDPNKRNIKRTPAFRLDKNAFIEKEHMFQRHLSQNHIKSKMDKFKSLDDSSRLKENCDNVNITKKTSDKVNDIKNKLYAVRDGMKSEVLNPRNENSEKIKKVTDVYAEAIPKSVRLTQKTNIDSDIKIETADKVITILKDIDQQVNGSDTIKNALKRPLPPGPAPKKPPRTFQHSPQSKPISDSLSVSKSDPNITTLKLDKEFTNQLNLSIEKRLGSPKKTKKDPTYMLEKLENALKGNKIKLHRQAKFDYTSDEDDRLKSPSKSLSNSPLLKRLNNTSTSTSSNQMFNCLPSFGCSKNAYAKIKEPNSSFFISSSEEEPVYAEPFQFGLERTYDIPCTDENINDMKRNSLYYMSNPVLGLKLDTPKGVEVATSNEEMESGTTTIKEMVNQSETSSLSAFSDTDSNASTSPAFSKEPSLVLVKDLIKSFEGKASGHDSDTDRPKRIPLRGFTGTDSNSVIDGRRYGFIKDGNKTGERKKKDTRKFEIYVKTVRAFSIRKMSNDNLFHCCLLVGLDEKSPYIKSKFPTNVQIPAYIEDLCFPDSDGHRVNYSAREQSYSLVITDASGERIYGYCRRVLPEGSSCCLPLAYCILTKNRAPRFYKKILQQLELHHGLPDKQRDALINEFYKQKFPKPGQPIKLDIGKIIHSDVKYYGSEMTSQNNNEPNRKSNGSLEDFCLIQSSCPHGFIGNSCDLHMICKMCRDENSSELVLALHQDVRYEETNLKELCDTLDTSILLKVFENLLLERKIIFSSCQLSKLSACIEAIQSVLYPFSWPHAFIPVLPKTRWGIVEAPAPLICGVLSPTVVNDYKIENGIVIDLDTKQILLEVDEEEKILPCSVIKYWRKGLSIASSIKTTDNEQNVLLSDAFIRVFIMTCGHYKDYITNGIFDKQGFKDFPTSKGVKRFLQWFTLTTMFDLFIEAVLSNPDSFYIFDSRIKIYSSQDATLILEKMKDWTNNLKL